MKMPKLVLLLIVFITACTPTTPVAQEAVLSSSSPTSSPTTVHTPKNTKRPPRPTSTKSPTRTRRPTPITPTITPYPTFEAKDIKTHVPFPPAVCPPENPDYQFAAHLPNEPNNTIEIAFFTLQNLDSGASFRQLMEEIDQTIKTPTDLELKDLTGDGVLELIIPKGFNTLVIGCEEGQYRTILDYSTVDDGGNFFPSIVTVQDLNLNGVPDVVLAYTVTTGWNTVIDILEWDGVQFNSLIKANHGENSPATSPLAKVLYWYDKDWIYSPAGNKPNMNGLAAVDIRDLDNDGTKELILTDDGPGHWDTLYTFGPWRGQQVIFKWDGVHYLYSSLEMAAPVYRFQAVQDADRYFLLGEYDKALRFYQDVIFNEKLDWWSADKMTFIRNSAFAEWKGEATPVPPPPNEDEYPALAAYARYRILLHHLSRGWINDASTVYTALIEQYPEGSAGSPYAAMATILWTEYQKTSSLDQSCRPVVDYAASHPGILAPLGDFYHGGQSHSYVAEDVCPFIQSK